MPTKHSSQVMPYCILTEKQRPNMLFSFVSVDVHMCCDAQLGYNRQGKYC